MHMELKSKMKTKKYLKGHVDLTTGKIHGCPKGSWKWYHEKGHIEFNRLESTSWILMLKSYIFSAWMFFVTLALISKYFIVLTGLAWTAYIFFGIYEEDWCNKYADRHYKK